MQGVRLLKENGLSFYTIGVITAYSLEFPDEIYDFFVANGLLDVGLNFAEQEGVNRYSDVLRAEELPRVKDFVSTFARRVLKDRFKLRWREMEQFLGLLQTRKEGETPPSQTARPGAIINVDIRGNFSTFSPELLGTLVGGRPFHFGNVHHDSFDSMYDAQYFQAVSQGIGAGLDLCKRICEYWPTCGGGAPSNKWFENGSFSSAETRYCRLNFQLLPSIILVELDRYIDSRTNASVPRESIVG